MLQTSPTIALTLTDCSLGFGYKVNTEVGDMPLCDGCVAPGWGATHRALIRYSARLMLAWEPVMVTCLSVEPSTGLAILIWAPDI